MKARTERPAPATPFGKALRRIAATIGTWVQRARDRRDLAGLDERQRRDVGLDAEAIRRATGKPLWRA